jgi:DNA-binding transcriptional MerR regulator
VRVHEDDRYTLTELADLGGVTPRTVRYYMSQGLLPAVGQSGPGAKYGAGHLARLRLIRRLQTEHLPLAEIRRRLEGLDDDTIAELAGSDEPAAPPDTALEYLRGVLGPRPGQPGTDAMAEAPASSSRPLHQRLFVEAPAPDTPAGRSFLRSVRPGPAAPLMAPGGAPIAFPDDADVLDLPDVAAPDAPIGVAEGLGDYTVSAVQAVPAGPAQQAPDRSQWERIALAPDVELHIRRPLSRSLNKAVDRLITIARELLQEDPS